MASPEAPRGRCGDAVDVVFRRIGQFEIDHAGQFDDVDARGAMSVATSSCTLPCLKPSRRQALHLRLVAVDDAGRHAAFLQAAPELVGGDLGAGEHQPG